MSLLSELPTLVGQQQELLLILSLQQQQQQLKRDLNFNSRYINSTLVVLGKEKKSNKSKDTRNKQTKIK